MAEIKPTVARMVHFYPGAHNAFFNAKPGEPLAAIVAAVNADGTLNLSVIDSEGYQSPAKGIPLLQNGCQTNIGGDHCEWMPYQVGQAQKTEEVQSQLEQVRRMASAGALLIKPRDEENEKFTPPGHHSV